MFCHVPPFPGLPFLPQEPVFSPPDCGPAYAHIFVLACIRRAGCPGHASLRAPFVTLAKAGVHLRLPMPPQPAEGGPNRPRQPREPRLDPGSGAGATDGSHAMRSHRRQMCESGSPIAGRRMHTSVSFGPVLHAPSSAPFRDPAPRVMKCHVPSCSPSRMPFPDRVSFHPRRPAFPPPRLPAAPPFPRVSRAGGRARRRRRGSRT